MISCWMLDGECLQVDVLSVLSGADTKEKAKRAALKNFTNPHEVVHKETHTSLFSIKKHGDHPPHFSLSLLL